MSLRFSACLIILVLTLPLAGRTIASGGTANGKKVTEADLANAKPGRDPNQPIDEEYTRKIKRYTTETFFLSPLVDYLPASKSVPTPAAVLGDIAGAEGKLPYTKEVYEYMRLLAKSTPRVKVYSIGTSEEGREMLAVAVASEALIAKLDQNRADLAKLADPRTIKMDDDAADEIARRAAPVYYITGTIHSSEAGAPTALMELAYRLAVDDSLYVRNIREHVITLITPVVEPDGRDRVVDAYEWRKKHPTDTPMNAVYWGHYVAHDNNRDAMALTLKLSQNVLNTYLSWKAQVLHDLHESGSFLYDNTIGNGPYNAWLDPILTNEWHLIGWNNVNEMTRMGMPGVYAWGTFDTWSPGYLMFMAATHNGISRLYETFGNSGSADTEERTLTPAETSRTWYRQNPPISRVRWSLRNNNNYEETGILISLNYVASNRVYFLRNFYDKSKRSILKARVEGPAAYVFPANDPRPGAQAELLRVMQRQAVEVSRATQAFTLKVPVRGSARATARAQEPTAATGATVIDNQERAAEASAEPPQTQASRPRETTQEFPAGSYIIRMDQPYSRIADALLDYQYWAPNDPQTRPYDDTGWTFPEGFAVQAVRVTDASVLNVPVTPVTGAIAPPSGITGGGGVFAVNHNADNALVTLRYVLKDADIELAEEPFESAGRKFNRGTFLIRGVAASDLDRVTRELGLQAHALSTAPSVKMHPARACRVAILHQWSSTQTEGWWRQAFDLYRVPYDYIDPDTIRRTADLRAKYDVIIFGPGGNSSAIEGTPLWRTPVPYRNSAETPNVGTWAETDDTRIGMGLEGLMHLREFINTGGVFVAANSSADFAISNNFAYGVSANRPGAASRVVGSLLRTRLVDATSPVVYGVPDHLAVYSDSGDTFTVSANVGGGSRAREAAAPRATGRGTPDDPDVVQGRPSDEGTNLSALPPPEPVQPWQYALPTDEQLKRNPATLIPPPFRPRVAMRFEAQNSLLVSGLLGGGADIAQRAVVVDVPVGRGHVVLFANNPIYRGETIGSYFMVFNTILSFDSLDAGRTLDPR
jgi:zinc carboxypeptidase